MPPFGPIKRRDLIRALGQLGFEEYRRSDHLYMVRGRVQIRIPNTHRGDISRSLLAALLRQAGISRSEWEAL